MTDFTGTENDDSINLGFDGANVQALGGDDIIRMSGTNRGNTGFEIFAGTGNDTFEFDVLNYGAEIYFYGEAGNDIANVGGRSQLGPDDLNIFLDMGDGDDVIAIHGDGVYTMTLGAGRDLVIVDDLFYDLIFTDFDPGEDVFSWELLYPILDWDGETNLFEAGYFTLEQDGTDVRLLADFDGAGTVYENQLGAIFQNLTVADFTNASLPTLLPQGGVVPGLTLTGTQDANIISGGLAGDIMRGLGGNDIIDGRDGNDTIEGGDGNDTLVGGFGDDTLMGGAGDDFLRDGLASGNYPIVYNGDGLDDDILIGGDGDDYLLSESGDDRLEGGDGNDTLMLTPGTFSTRLFTVVGLGGAGDDTIVARGILDFIGQIDAGDGDDRVEVVGQGDSFGSSDAAIYTVDLGEGYDDVSVSGEIDAILTLGAGQDVVRVTEFTFNSNIIVTDFQTGDMGDVLRMDLTQSRLVTPGGDLITFLPDLAVISYRQVGADTVVAVDLDADGAFEAVDLVTLQNVQMSDLTLFNQGGLGDPMRPEADLGPLRPIPRAPEQAEIGSNDAETLNGTADADTLYGLDGADNLVGGAGNDWLFGDLSSGLDVTDWAVFRAYRVVFNRDPDVDGFEAFSRAIRINALTANDMLSEFIASAEFELTYGALSNRDFMRLLYQNAFGREADPDGLENFTATLNDGRSRESVVEEFYNSGEFQTIMAPFAAGFAVNTAQVAAEGFVYRLYQAAFGREPDGDGFTNFANVLRAQFDGTGYEYQFANEFLFSEEFQLTYGELSNAEFVEALYANVLPGNTDPVGRANFIAALDDPLATITRVDMLLEFVNSQELRLRTDADVEAFTRALFDGPENDTLVGGEGDDILFGGRGRDVFSFDLSNNGGRDTILDFAAGYDIIALSGDDMLTEFSAILALSQQVGTNVVIDFGDGQTITLANVLLADLTSDDFDFGVTTAQEPPSAESSPADNLPDALDGADDLNLWQDLDGF